MMTINPTAPLVQGGGIMEWLGRTIGGGLALLAGAVSSLWHWLRQGIDAFLDGLGQGLGVRPGNLGDWLLVGLGIGFLVLAWRRWRARARVQSVIWALLGCVLIGLVAT